MDVSAHPKYMLKVAVAGWYGYLMCGAVVTPSEQVDKVQPHRAVLINGSPPRQVAGGGRLSLAAGQYHAIMYLHVRGSTGIRHMFKCCIQVRVILLP